VHPVGSYFTDISRCTVNKTSNLPDYLLFCFSGVNIANVYSKWPITGFTLEKKKNDMRFDSWPFS